MNGLLLTSKVDVTNEKVISISLEEAKILNVRTDKPWPNTWRRFAMELAGLWDLSRKLGEE